ncbi:MAG: gamma carbonic anhydrase family protein, partial [Candidatus Bathyarchaeia archaeon]
NEIRVGKYTSVQDNVVVHVDADSPASIGNYIRIGHSAVLHGCTVRDYALIGIGAIVYNGVEVGEGAVVGMGAVVAPGTKVPPASVMLGIPAKPARKVTDEEKKEFLDGTIRYAQLGQAHRVALISQET